MNNVLVNLADSLSQLYIMRERKTNQVLAYVCYPTIKKMLEHTDLKTFKDLYIFEKADNLTYMMYKDAILQYSQYNI